MKHLLDNFFLPREKDEILLKSWSHNFSSFHLIGIFFEIWNKRSKWSSGQSALKRSISIAELKSCTLERNTSEKKKQKEIIIAPNCIQTGTVFPENSMAARLHSSPFVQKKTNYLDGGTLSRTVEQFSEFSSENIAGISGARPEVGGGRGWPFEYRVGIILVIHMNRVPRNFSARQRK